MWFACTCGVLFLSISLVLENVAIGVKGERCSSAPLDYNGHNHGLCELLVKEALGEYRTIECRQYPSISSCISNFCRDVSSCLSQTWKWRKLCFWRFFWFRLGKFDITAWKEVQSNTSIRNLQLGYCSRTYSSSHGRWRVNYKFSIITTEYSDHSENEGSKANDDNVDRTFEGTDPDDPDLITEITYDLSTLDVLNNNSLKEAVDIIARKIDEYINSTAASGQTGNTTITSHEKMQRILMTTIAFEEFVLELAETHLSESAPVVHFTSEKIDLQVRRASWENETDFHLKDAKNYIQLPSTNFHNGSTILGVMYKDLHRMFATTSTEQDTPGISSKNLNTIITSVTMRAESDKLRENVVLGFKNVQVTLLFKQYIVEWLSLYIVSVRSGFSKNVI